MNGKSPRWLVKRGREEEARGVLERLGAADVGRELAEIVASLRAKRRTAAMSGSGSGATDAFAFFAAMMVLQLLFA